MIQKHIIECEKCQGLGHYDIDESRKINNTNEIMTKFSSIKCDAIGCIDGAVEVEKRDYLSWKMIMMQMNDMAGFVKDHFMLDTNTRIVGIPRGGLIPATILSHLTGIPMLSMDEEFRENLMEPEDEKPCYVLDGKQYDILLIDDIVDTGETMKRWESLLDSNSPITMSIHYKKNEIHTPDFHALEKADRWIVYPWENDKSTGEGIL